MGHVDILYWKVAAVCFVVGIFFFFITTETLIRGKLRLPSWVFSMFTMVIGTFFFRIFVNSMSEFGIGQTGSVDELMKAWELIRDLTGKIF